MKAWAKQVLAPAARFATRQCARVIMYHRFTAGGAGGRLDVQVLDQQLRYLRRHYKVVSLHDVIVRLRSGMAPEPYSVAVTVDDAYADFGDIAYPVFQRHGVPVTLYVVSEFAGGRMWLWWDMIRQILMSAPNGQYAPRSSSISLSDATSRERAWQELAGVGLALSPGERQGYIASLQAVFGVPLPGVPPREFAALSWDELRGLDPKLVDIGAHTRTHPILSRCESPQIQEEVAGSKSEIEAALGREVRSFCYPNGTWSDVDARCLAAVREAGYEGAVMACGTLVCRGADVYALDRIGPSEKRDDFASEISGISHIRRRALKS